MNRFHLWIRFRLRTKLTLLIEGLIIVIVATTGAITSMEEKETLERELRKRGLALAGDLAIFAAKPLLADDLATLRRFVKHSMNEDYVRDIGILDPGGKVVMHSNLEEVGAIHRDELSRTAIAAEAAGYTASTLDARGEGIYTIYAPVTVAEARLGTVVLGYSRSAAEEEFALARRRIVSLGLLTAAAGGILAFFLSSYISTPIKRITDAMQTASNADVSTVLSVDRKDEIGALASTFNQMAEDLAKHRKHLEVLVEARTAQLKSANARLQLENADRIKAEEELRKSQEQLRDLASYLQLVREQERTQIAREIHDELGHALTALKMDVHWRRHRLNQDQQVLCSKTKTMSKLIDSTVHAVRRISSELRPKLLDDLGISAAIEWQAQEFQDRTGVRCDVWSDPDDVVLNQPQSTALFRIFQETLVNVARHAGASRVEVILRKDTEKVEMSVLDDGRGITAKQASDSKSLGIVGMRERVLSLGGDLIIAGVPDLGTTVRVTIPI